MPLEICYFTGGQRERVLRAILLAGHRVLRVYVNDPQRWPKTCATVQLAKELDIPVTVIERKSDIGKILPEISGKICFSAGFNYLFDEKFLKLVAICLNVHGSLLPRYAGARTLSWAIVHGESESGVTVHQVDAGVDTGPILLQKAFPLSKFETTRSLGRKTAAFEPEIVVEALARYEALGRLGLVPQPVPPPPLLPNRMPEHSRIDPSRPLIALIDEIRASDPDDFPAWFELHGEKVCVRLWRPRKPPGEEDLI